jgi:signal transduction histidine kinase
MAEQNNHLQEVNEEIYKRNLELAVVNKTLSLLRKLYQISLRTLDPETLSEAVSETVRTDLNMEAVGVFLYQEKTNSLKAFKFSESERLQSVLKKFDFNFEKHEISIASNKSLLKQVVLEKTWRSASDLQSVWGDAAEAKTLASLTKESHIKTVLLYPLVLQEKIIGMLFLALNRDYETLNEYERDSIDSLDDVVAVALDKALLYEQLKDLNDQLKALDKARADFITIASHQLRTPPATIKWYLSALLSNDYGPMSDSVREELEKAQITNNGLIALIDDMLNASRIERGKMEFLFEEVSLEEITKTVYEQMIPLATVRKLGLVYKPPTGTIPHVMADREKIRQVVNNFIDNALKYTKAGSVTVEVLSRNDAVEVRVSNTGKGLSEEERKSLFEKYTRGKDAMTHSAGLGLGLYVAKIIMAQHKGKIWAESPGVDKGSTFAFSIPVHTNLPTTSTLDLVEEKPHN